MTDPLTEAELSQLGRLLAKARQVASPSRTHQEARYHADARTVLQPLIYVDLDNTLAKFDWPGIENYDPLVIGPPLPHARQLLEQLCKLGTVRIHTVRLSFKSLMPTQSPYLKLKEAVQAWLQKHDLPLVELEEFPHPFCVAYVGNDAISVPVNYDVDVPLIIAAVKHKCNRYSEEAT